MLKKEAGSKKSQVAIFLIMGTVILIITIGIIYFAKMVKEKNTEDKTLEINKIPYDLEPFVNYMDACVETVAKKGIFLLGAQGGSIYMSQGGKTFDYQSSLEGEVFLRYKGNIVPYLIDLPVSGFYCNVTLPQYPVLNWFMAYPYLWFNSTMPDLERGKEYKVTDCFGKSNPISENQAMLDLKSYMEKHIRTDCSFASFKNLRINSSEAIATITADSSTTKFSLAYPMEIVNLQSGSKTDLRDFTISIKLSVKEIFNFANTIMQFDVDDPTYDLRKSYDQYDFKVSIVPNVLKFDDIVEISSDSLSLDGQPFKMVFARRNHYPVLEFVYNTSFESVPLIEGYSINWSSVVLQTLSAVDPDEDNVTIKVIMGADLLHPKELTKESHYIINFNDVNEGHLLARITASDGQYADYQDFVIK